MALSVAFIQVMVIVMALLAAFTHQMSLQEGKQLLAPPSLDPPQVDLYKTYNPYIATIRSVESIGHHACRVLIEHDGNVPCWEGQCYKVLIPGTDANYFAYFMLATTRYGDYFDGKTASLCVRRAGEVSQYLCDAKPGDKVGIAGPSFRNMLFAQDNPIATQIMVATDTGIAPFRGFIRRIFVENVPFKFSGKARLFYGAENKESSFYDEELSKYAKEHPRNFTYENAIGGAEGVDRLIRKNISEIYDELTNEISYISFCGLKSMMNRIYIIFEEEAKRRDEDWKVVFTHLLETKQWREITYEYGCSSSKNLVEEMIPETHNMLRGEAAKTKRDKNRNAKLPQHEATIYDYGEAATF